MKVEVTSIVNEPESVVTAEKPVAAVASPDKPAGPDIGAAAKQKQETAVSTPDAGSALTAAVQSLSAPDTYGDRGVDEDTAKLLLVPNLIVVQRISALASNFTPGSVVASSGIEARALWEYPRQQPSSQPAQNREAPRPPLRLVFLTLDPVFYVDATPGVAWEGGSITCSTPQQVAEAGGTLDFASFKSGAFSRFFAPATRAVVLVKRPDIPLDGMEDIWFPFEADGEYWGFFRWSLRSSAFTSICRRTLFPLRVVGPLRNGLHLLAWDLIVFEETFSTGNRAFVPKLSQAGATPKGLSVMINRGIEARS